MKIHFTHVQMTAM